MYVEYHIFIILEIDHKKMQVWRKPYNYVMLERELKNVLPHTIPPLLFHWTLQIWAMP